MSRSIPIAAPDGGDGMMPVRDVRASRDQMIYRGTSFARDEIVIAARQVVQNIAVLTAATKVLAEVFAKQEMVEIKIASETVAAAAATVETGARQIKALSNSLADTFGQHVRRRPRT